MLLTALRARPPFPDPALPPSCPHDAHSLREKACTAIAGCAIHLHPLHLVAARSLMDRMKKFTHPERAPLMRTDAILVHMALEPWAPHGARDPTAEPTGGSGLHVRACLRAAQGNAWGGHRSSDNHVSSAHACHHPHANCMHSHTHSTTPPCGTLSRLPCELQVVTACAGPVTRQARGWAPLGRPWRMLVFTDGTVRHGGGMAAAPSGSHFQPLYVALLLPQLLPRPRARKGSVWRVRGQQEQQLEPCS